MHWFIHGGVGVLTANQWPGRPLLAIAVSFSTHYLLDWLPHKDPGIASTTARWRSPEVREFLTLALPDGIFTGALALIVPWFFWSMPFGLTAGCVLASVAPDLIDGVAKLTNRPLLQRHLAFHNWIPTTTTTAARSTGAGTSLSTWSCLPPSPSPRAT